MDAFVYYLRRFVAILPLLLMRAAAIALGGICTWYTAATSWDHFQNLLGPIAAVSAAAAFVFAERASHRRHMITMLTLGVLAAAISGSVILKRNAETSAASLHEVQSANLPRITAAKAVAEAQTRLAAAEAAVLAETKDGGCGPVCEGLKKEAKAAREALTEARARRAALGAEQTESATASVLGAWAGTFDRALTVAPSLWLELAAPAFWAFGFAPLPRRQPAPAPAQAEPVKKPKAKKGKPRQPPGKPSPQTPTARAFRRPKLRLVAVNDNAA